MKKRPWKIYDASISVTVYRRIRNLSKDTGFTSVSQFIIYALRDHIINGEKEEELDSMLTADNLRVLRGSKKNIVEARRYLTKSW